ncbi:MAG: F0F1 ATP synthase subunit delta [Desulfobacteraceae bacterium]|nr:F0F1 ATP synthase subunit delta [Desulfobacteraceae bacterium]
MKNLIIAKRYSRALFSLAEEGTAIEQYGEELDGFNGVLKEFPDLGNALRNPLYPEAVKRSLCAKVAEGQQLSPVVKSFLNLLVVKRRVQDLPDICEYYHKLIDEHSNIARAQVKAAVDLGDNELKKIAAALEKKVGKKIVVEFKRDAALLGGVYAQIGDLVLDGSVKRQLLNFKESLKRGAVG